MFVRKIFYSKNLIHENTIRCCKESRYSFIHSSIYNKWLLKMHVNRMYHVCFVSLSKVTIC